MDVSKKTMNSRIIILSISILLTLTIIYFLSNSTINNPILYTILVIMLFTSALSVIISGAKFSLANLSSKSGFKKGIGIIFFLGTLLFCLLWIFESSGRAFLPILLPIGLNYFMTFIVFLILFFLYNIVTYYIDYN